MLIFVFEEHMLVSNRNCFEHTSPADSHCGVGIHMILVVIALSNTGTNWRVVRDLLSKVFVVFTNQFKCFTKNRVKWLVQTVISAFVLCYAKCCNKHYSLNWIILLVCSHQSILVLHDFCNLLNHADWLIEINRNTEL
jgi:hypothetical protein